MLSVTIKSSMLNVIMPSAVMLNVIMLNVVAPHCFHNGPFSQEVSDLELLKKASILKMMVGSS
jgi:hypothetical protein